MNKPEHTFPPKLATSPLYDEDGYGWAMAQARFLRERQLDAIDWDNVAEEIESMGKSEMRAAESALRVVLLHRLKWEYQITFRSRSWRNSIIEQLERFDEELGDNPSLKPRLDEIRTRAYRRARYEAAQETGLDIALFPKESPSWEAIRAPLAD